MDLTTSLCDFPEFSVVNGVLSLQVTKLNGRWLGPEPSLPHMSGANSCIKKDVD
jgi:hypothetical protein